MTPEQKLIILAKCAALAPLPDASHDQWKSAYKDLLELVKKKPEGDSSDEAKS